MKKIFLILSFVFVSTISVKAQDSQTAWADKLFKRFEYLDASKEYLKLVGNGIKQNYIYNQLAESYYNMFNTTEAIKWYALSLTQPQEAETYFKYAQMLKASGRYEESNAQMAIFASKNPKDIRAILFNENPNYIPKLLIKQKVFNLVPVTINSQYTDFGPKLANDNTLYFSSSRKISKKKTGWKEESYLDVYQATLLDNDSLSAPTEVEDINTIWHDGPACVSSDGNTIYFSRDSREINDFEDIKNIKTKFSQMYLFKATKENNKWTAAKQLPFNDKSYSISNPSISIDGKTLYFNSNMPGGLGGNDIWKVAVSESDIYETPVNLGSKVNTEGNEQFPSITDDNVLYFSSDSRQGLGGLDVYFINLNKSEDAQNIGKPVNSEKDDFSFSFNTKRNLGFFSSNREESDDLYIAKPLCNVESTIHVTNAVTGVILEGATVSILDDKKNIIETKISDVSGNVDFILECNTEYSLQVAKDGFESGVFGIAKNKGGKLNVPTPLNPIEVIIKPTEIVLNPIYFEFNKSNITQEGAFELDKLVQVMKANDKLVIFAKSHTDNRGSDVYNMNLSERRAKSTVQYVLSKGIVAARISGKGFGETEPKVDCKETCTEEEHAQNRRSEFLIVK
ncbi:MAG: OmpA family protein [Flavobacterium sp.]|jgi:outer membrane protein OmpA-like peptidoglycan-associated protein/tetratricopeptide (TPR) repeat protein|nr:OmpA family protein [Flavobacterium sp.]